MASSSRAERRLILLSPPGSSSAPSSGRGDQCGQGRVCLAYITPRYVVSIYLGQNPPGGSSYWTALPRAAHDSRRRKQTSEHSAHPQQPELQGPPSQGQTTPQGLAPVLLLEADPVGAARVVPARRGGVRRGLCLHQCLSLIHISEPTRLGMISYAVFCLK